MKIVYVGNFERNSVGEPEVAKCLEELGHEVVRINEFDTSLGEIDKQLDGAAFLLYAKFRVGMLAARRQFFKTCRVPTVCWVFDLYIGL